MGRNNQDALSGAVRIFNLPNNQAPDEPAETRRRESPDTEERPVYRLGPVLSKEIIGANEDGEPVKWGGTAISISGAIRCVAAGTARTTVCDGTHAKAGFDGTETRAASRISIRPK